MTNKIPALADGSPCLDSICHDAAWTASRLQAGGDLLHVMTTARRPEAACLAAIGVGARAAIHDDLAKADMTHARLAQTKGPSLLDCASKALERDGTKEVVQRLWQGDLSDRVAGFCAEFASRVRLVVMGRQGAGADSCSNVERIMRASSVPALVVRQAWTGQSRTWRAAPSSLTSM